MEKLFVITSEYHGMRLDKFLSLQLDFISRSKIHGLFKQSAICVNGLSKKPSYHLKNSERVEIRLEEPPKDILKPYAFAVNIIYEDGDILVIDKPQGLIVHPAGLNQDNTLVNALTYMKKDLSTVNPYRPGVVHRLDKDTSGLMVLAKNNRSHLNLVEQFSERKVKKEYVAVCWGIFSKEKLTLDLPLARDKRNRLKMKISFLKAKEAHTEFAVLEKLKDATSLLIKPTTGRMHQIRVHLKFLDHPIVGDKKYGLRDGYQELFLHAYRLGIFHPTNAQFLEFSSSIPERFTEFINAHR